MGQTSTQQGGSVTAAAFADLQSELGSTRRILERVPDEHLAWKPHEKSMSLGDLAAHIANLVYWTVSIAGKDEYDLSSGPTRQPSPGSAAEVVAAFDRNMEALNAAIASLQDERLGQTWTLRHGDHVILAMPRGAAIRTMGISHIAHHRGQLSVYLRLLDVPVPGLYGPSADEHGG